MVGAVLVAEHSSLMMSAMVNIFKMICTAFGSTGRVTKQKNAKHTTFRTLEVLAQFNLAPLITCVL